MMSEFHFLRPFWLLALLPFVAILLLLLRSRLRQGNWSAVCDAELLPYLLQNKPVKTRRWQLGGGALAGWLMIIALAGPTWQRLPSPVFRNDSALVIALDLSVSMDAADIKPSRLIRARYKIADILKQRKDGQTALLVYAAEPYVVTPLTDDTQTIASQLEALTTKIMPNQGNNTTAALAKAADLLKQSGQQTGDILLVTDGVAHADTLPEINSSNRYRISVLAVGTEDGAPIATGAGGFVKDDNGDIIVPRLDIAGLKQLAAAGHGIFQLMGSNDSDVMAVNRFTSQAEAAGRDKQKRDLLLEQWSDKGPWLILPILPLAALLFRRGLLIFLIILLPWPETGYALSWDELWQTKNQQAHRAFREGDYAKAEQLFENPAWKAAAQYKSGHYEQALQNLQQPKTADDFYNQGNALAKAGKFEDAISAYDQALKQKPEDADTQYNKALVQKQLEKQQQDQNQNQQSNSDKSNPQDQKKQKSNDNQDNRQQDSPQPQENADSRQSEANEDGQQPAEERKSEQGQPQDSQNLQEKQAEQAQESPLPKDDQNHDKATADQQQAQALEQLRDEKTQANQQWLNRIPDDPAGLLKRKFLYQYGQQERKQSGQNYRNW